MRVARISTEHGPLLVEEGDNVYWPLRAGARGLASALADGPLGTGDLVRDPDASAVSGQVMAPLRPGKIVAIGLNYLDHIRETGLPEPAEPLVFTKFTTSVIGPDEQIRFDPAHTERVDWEVELAVVIGRPARQVSEADALDHVAGYTVANDVSARDLQFRDQQWVRGKSLDTFCPLGPVVVSPDEVGDPQALRLSTTVNGEVVQDSSTSEMVFSVAQLVAHCSRSFTLEPGDVILTGTPWGCGEFMEPRRSLGHGDVVTVEVERIGALTNPVRHALPTSVRHRQAG